MFCGLVCDVLRALTEILRPRRYGIGMAVGPYLGGLLSDRGTAGRCPYLVYIWYLVFGIARMRYPRATRVRSRAGLHVASAVAAAVSVVNVVVLLAVLPGARALQRDGAAAGAAATADDLGCARARARYY